MEQSEVAAHVLSENGLSNPAKVDTLRSPLWPMCWPPRETTEGLISWQSRL